MTDNQETEIIFKVSEEFEDLRQELITKDSETVFDSANKIYTYRELSKHIVMNAKDYDYKGFPKTKILEYFYKKFLVSNYNFTNSDLKLFFKYQTNLYKSKQNEL